MYCSCSLFFILRSTFFLGKTHVVIEEGQLSSVVGFSFNELANAIAASVSDPVRDSFHLLLGGLEEKVEMLGGVSKLSCIPEVYVLADNRY